MRPFQSVKAMIAGVLSRPEDDPVVVSQARLGAFYREHFDFVWRSVRRLGVPDANVDDAVQDVFLVVHRRLAEFDGRAPRSWLFAIALRVVSDHRRTIARKGADPLPEVIADARTPTPHESAESSEALELVDALLAELSDEKRIVLVLAELEQMTVPEIAQAIGVNVNTVYSRLRAARIAFDEALARHRAGEERGEP